MDKIVQIKNDVKLHEWSMMVKACRSSGLSVSQWCNENGINLKTYYYRLRIFVFIFFKKVVEVLN